MAPGVPRKRKSTVYCLETRGRHYPPKYVLMRAHILQTGTKPIGLIGGSPSNAPLRNLEYVIREDCACGRHLQLFKLIRDSQPSLRLNPPPSAC